MDLKPEDELDSGTALIAAVALTVVSMAAFLVLPLYVGAAAGDLGLNQQQIGFLASAVAGGSALSSVAMMFLVRRVPWRLAGLVTLSLLLIPMGLSVLVEDVQLFMLLQGLAALGSGSTYSLALTALAERRHPDRAFGFSVAAQVSFQVFGMLVLPGLIAKGGIDAILLLFVAMEVAALLLLFWLPKQGRTLVATRHAGTLFSVPLLLALGGCFLFFFNIGAVWTYIERMAVLAGFSAAQIGNSLAIGVSLGIPGALLASWCGDRFGRIGPLAVGAAGAVVALMLLGEGMSLQTYVLAACLYNFVWNFSLSFQYAAVNAVDTSGQGVAAAPAFHGAGAALGPGVAAMYVTESNLGAVNWVAGLAVILSLLLFVVAISLVRRGGDFDGQTV